MLVFAQFKRRSFAGATSSFEMVMFRIYSKTLRGINSRRTVSACGHHVSWPTSQLTVSPLTVYVRRKKTFERGTDVRLACTWLRRRPSPQCVELTLINSLNSLIAGRAVGVVVNRCGGRPVCLFFGLQTSTLRDSLMLPVQLRG